MQYAICNLQFARTYLLGETASGTVGTRGTIGSAVDKYSTIIGCPSDVVLKFWT